MTTFATPTDGAATAPGPPHSLEAEQSVLGAILLSERAMYALVIEEGLKPEAFSRERHGMIYESMLALYRESEPIDVLTVSEHLRSTGKLEQAGGKAAIDELTGGVPGLGGIRRYAQIVREHALMRRLLSTTYEIQASVLNHSAAPRELVEQAERAMLEVAHDDLQKMEKLSREGTALTGTPSGFRDLDEITGGFQPGNLVIIAARPSMGKCQVGSTLVFDALTGARRRLDEVVAMHEAGEEVWVAAAGPDLRLRRARVSATFRNGVKPVVRVTTRLGRRTDLTANHPLLTLDGWKRVDELQAGSRIGVPCCLPRPMQPQHTPDHEIVLLADLVADGCRHHRICDDTSVPDAIFGLDDRAIARFLGILFACDGHVSATDRLRRVGYCTTSERLAHDVQHLLLRLGIVSCLRTLERTVCEGTEKVAREVQITGRDAVRRFRSVVDIPGKAPQTGRARARLTAVGCGTNVATSAQKLADCSGDAELDQYAASDLWWDEIVSIEPIGEEETFDLTV